MTSLRRVFSCFVLLLLLVLGILLKPSSVSAAAATGTNLTTSPVLLDLDIKPGTSSTQTLKIYNNGATALPIVMQIKTFGAYGTTGQASINNFQSFDPAASYIKLSPSAFTAQPHVWTDVTASIKLPLTASLGYYYAIIFQPLTGNQTGKFTEVVKGENAILALVDTGSSNEQKQVEIYNFTSSKGLYEYLPATFNVTIRNRGNIFLAPTGDIYISRNSNGAHTIDSLPINSSGGNVLPDSNRVFQASWSSGFPHFVPDIVNGQPKLVGDVPVEKLNWDLNSTDKFRFGKYYAFLAIAYNNGTHEILLNSSLSFWVIPWKLMLIVLAILLLLLAGFWFIGRALIRRVKGRKHFRKRR